VEPRPRSRGRGRSAGRRGGKAAQGAVRDPEGVAHPEDQEQLVPLTVSKELVEDSPPLKDGVLDRHAVAAHYGLTQG